MIHFPRYEGLVRVNLLTNTYGFGNGPNAGKRRFQTDVHAVLPMERTKLPRWAAAYIEVQFWVLGQRIVPAWKVDDIIAACELGQALDAA